MIDLEDIRQDIFDIKTVPKVLYVYRGDTFELDLDLTISSSELSSVVLNCDGLPEATSLTLLETTNISSKWHLLLNKTQTLILAPKSHNFTITIVRTDGTELTLYKGIMAVNNRVYSNYSNNYYIATLLKQTVPTASDNDYLIGTMWVNVLTDRVYFLTSVVNNEAKWIDYSDQFDKLHILIDDTYMNAKNYTDGEVEADRNRLNDLENNKASKDEVSELVKVDETTIDKNALNELKIAQQVLDLINDKIEQNALDGFVYQPTYDNETHTLTLPMQNEMSLVIDLDLERLIMNIDLEDNDLVFTFEDESVKRIPLGSLLVGMASEQWVNAKLDNYYNEGEVDNKDTAASNILNANPNIVFENEVIYNRRFRGWKEIGEVPIYLRKDEIGTNRIQGSAIVGDEIFWIGGTTTTIVTSRQPSLLGASNKNISYNLKTNTWKENPDLPVRKDAPTLVAVGTDIYILGSFGRTNQFSPHETVFAPDYKYDTITNTYEELNSLQDNDYLYVSHQSSGADHLEGKLYISGRYWVRKEKTTGTISNFIEPRIAIYDIENDTWSLGATPPMSNDGGSSQILDRKFYVYRNTLYAYDIDNDTWSSPLNVSGIESRSHTSMAKRDGKLYVIGGFISGSSPERTSGKTYVYDPILNAWEEDVDLVLNNDYGIGIGYSMAVVWNDRLVVFGGVGIDQSKYDHRINVEDEFPNSYVFIEEFKSEKDLTPIYEKSNRELNEHIEVFNDTTAKLAVSNVFTQPQQVPNATLPQHATNKLQVETMFEMFKRELRGYNLAMPDLTGKTEISIGVYRVYDAYGVIIDYNTFNGQYKINGTWTGVTGSSAIIYYSTQLIGYTTSIKVTIVSGTLPNGVTYRPSGKTVYTLINFEGKQLSIEYNENLDYIRMTNGATFNDFIYTVQIEKGSTATPYTLPGQIPQYKIVGEE